MCENAAVSENFFFPFIFKKKSDNILSLFFLFYCQMSGILYLY